MNRIRVGRPCIAILALAVVASVCAEVVVRETEAQTAVTRATLRTLFIGNSYTYFNNLGDIVSGIAAADRRGPQIVSTLAVRGGTTLKWHLENGTAVRELANGKWDYVVLQEQSLLGGTFVDGKPIVGDPAEFASSTREWVRRIRSVDATPVLYMTWARRVPPADAAKMQKELSDAYLTVGRELGVSVAPVGLAWAETQRRLRTLDLHTFDGSHPTAAGSYLAACVIYSIITGRSPVGAPSVVRGRPMVDVPEGTVVDSTLEVPLVDLPTATASELQQVAWLMAQRSVTGGSSKSLPPQ